ncbi:PfkB family carbohydrate kinase [Desulfovibrio sp. TomC]|uniref:PfkB family carbohydrate kinase n=1 Tax=Desulfovibrio sp. TomC TaxID=1562888 RepID=UPI0022B1CBEC|nr:PfkB family carbohydrate kinase [Desulfovibrio sp. TomC]
MLDQFVRGKVVRISPEAPIHILSIADEISMLGGAGNVVRNLATLGATVVFDGVVGDDLAGKTVRDLLDSYANVQSHLTMEPNRMTSVKTRFVAGPTHLLRTDGRPWLRCPWRAARRSWITCGRRSPRCQWSWCLSMGRVS